MTEKFKEAEKNKKKKLVEQAETQKERHVYIESSELTDDMEQAEIERKKRKLREKFQVTIKRVKRLSDRKYELEIDLMKLEVKKQTAAEETLRLKLEKARDEGEREALCVLASRTRAPV